jgi:AraC family transcriptional regulator
VLTRYYKVSGYVYAGPQTAFRHSAQVLDHPTLIAVEAGSFEYEIEESAGQATLGDLVFCPAEVRFCRKALSEITFHHIHFQELIHEGSGYPFPSGKISVQDVIRLSSTFNYLRKLPLLTNDPAVRLSLVNDYLIPDLLLLSELELLKQENRHKTKDLLMKQASQYIQLHACSLFSMRELAANLGISQSQLTRRFQAAYGIGPSAYVTTLRIEEAKKLLLETDDTLEAIAHRCGYDSGSYLCRIFTAKAGINPSSFRQQYRI